MSTDGPRSRLPSRRQLRRGGSNGDASAADQRSGAAPPHVSAPPQVTSAPQVTAAPQISGSGGAISWPPPSTTWQDSQAWQRPSETTTQIPAAAAAREPRTQAIRLAAQARRGGAEAAEPQRRGILDTSPVSFTDPATDVDSAVATDTPPAPSDTPLAPSDTPPAPSSPRRASRAGAPDATGKRIERTRRTVRAGRDLPAAIGVGVVLAAAVLGSLLYRKEIFVGLVSASVVLAVWELVGAFGTRKIQAPVIPLVVGSIGMLVSAYVARQEGLLVAFTMTAFGVLLWRIIDGIQGAVRDIAAGVFTAAYVPFLAGFTILMLAEADGAMRVLVFIGAVVASDVGGYAAGVLFGRHPMAPSVSPKKSWEGFAGSAVTSMVASSVGVTMLLDGPWWAGPAVGAAAAVTATLGDLSESLIKRDLGVKDMSSVLPGHGGMMDRLDSLLLSAPVGFVLLGYLVPVAT